VEKKDMFGAMIKNLIVNAGTVLDRHSKRARIIRVGKGDFLIILIVVILA
jgi:hypothetical protein